jgi:hypothetical protein
MFFWATIDKDESQWTVNLRSHFFNASRIAMKLLLKLFIAMMLFAGSAGAGPSKSEGAVSVAVQALRGAMLDGNKASLEALTHEKLSYGHSGGLVENREEFVEKLVSGKSDFLTMELSSQTIIVSGKTAIVRHLLKGATNDAGKPSDINLRVMQVWQKTGKHWKLIARQAVKITT